MEQGAANLSADHGRHFGDLHGVIEKPCLYKLFGRVVCREMVEFINGFVQLCGNQIPGGLGVHPCILNDDTYGIGLIRIHADPMQYLRFQAGLRGIVGLACHGQHGAKHEFPGLRNRVGRIQGGEIIHVQVARHVLGSFHIASHPK